MRIGRNLRRLSLVALVLPLATMLEASSWQTFASTAGGFSLLVPGRPQFRERVHQSFVGAIRENTYRVTSGDGDYSAEYSDLPWVAVGLGGPETIFRRAKEGVLSDNGGVEGSFNVLSLGKHPGRELTFQGPGRESGKARFFLVERRLYVLVASGANPANVQKFLDSFRLLQAARAKRESSGL